MSESMEATKQIRLFICLKILFFNVFVLGFVLSFIGLTNINWIVGHNYLFGIFNYCRGVADASSRHYVFVNEDNKFVHRAIDNLNCYSWTSSNRPSNFILYWTFLPNFFGSLSFFLKNSLPCRCICS